MILALTCALVLPLSNTTISSSGIVHYADFGHVIQYEASVPVLVRQLVEERTGRGPRVACTLATSRREPPVPDGHVTSIDPHPQYPSAFLVTCSCGWVSPPCFGRKAAERDAEYHKAGGTR